MTGSFLDMAVHSPYPFFLGHTVCNFVFCIIEKTMFCLGVTCYVFKGIIYIYLFLVFYLFIFLRKAFTTRVHNDIGILTGSPSDKFGTVKLSSGVVLTSSGQIINKT